MHEAGCQRVIELSWWQQRELVGDNGGANSDVGESVRFACVPAQHWSKRGLMDDNKV